MISGLSQNEAAAYNYISSGPRNIATLGLSESDTPDKFRNFLSNLLEAWQDNPREMLRALGFNLPSVLKMKFYDIETINRILADNRHVYRVLEETTATSKDAAWLAESGFIKDGRIIATIYIDSALNRYLRLSNGQLFKCSDADLKGMPEIDRMNIRAYLLKIID